MLNHDNPLICLEVWQFRLDTEENLLRCGGLPCSKVIANHSGVQPVITAIRAPPTPPPPAAAGGAAPAPPIDAIAHTQRRPEAAAAAAASAPINADEDEVASAEKINCFAVEDFRRSRLFERLGTLLKTLIVTTRLLPGEFICQAKPGVNLTSS